MLFLGAVLYHLTTNIRLEYFLCTSHLISMDKTGYFRMIEALESKLSDLKEQGYDIFNQAEEAIGFCILTC